MNYIFILLELILNCIKYIIVTISAIAIIKDIAYGCKGTGWRSLIFNLMVFVVAVTKEITLDTVLKIHNTFMIFLGLFIDK